MSKFKVGDRVVAISDYMGKEIRGKTGTVKGFGSKPRDPIGVEWDDFADGHNGCGFFSGKSGCCWFVPESCIERLARRDPSIHITTDGKTTHAVLKEGGKVAKRAKAVCSPHDEFDFTTGARIALDRLVGNPADASPGTVREVKRPAKVGDTVLLIKDPTSRYNMGQCKSGDILKIESYGTMPSVKSRAGNYIGFRDDEYVVLECYTPRAGEAYILQRQSGVCGCEFRLYRWQSLRI